MIKHGKNKIFSLIPVFVILSILFTTSTYALTPSNTTTTAQRNAIANNWTYLSRGYAEQNCLSYALKLGNVWTWPWGETPTPAQVKDYLTVAYGYNSFSTTKPTSITANPPHLLIYAKGNVVTHFARLYIPEEKWSAKWGAYEIFQHSNADPYQASGPYGPFKYVARK
jgi:hypothetical protein